MFPHEVSDDFSFTESRIYPTQSVTLGILILIVVILMDRHSVVSLVIDVELEAVSFDLRLHRGKMLPISDGNLVVVDF